MKDRNLHVMPVFFFYLIVAMGFGGWCADNADNGLCHFPRPNPIPTDQLSVSPHDSILSLEVYYANPRGNQQLAISNGTGFAISANCVLTAAHMVFNKEHGLAVRILCHGQEMDMYAYLKEYQAAVQGNSGGTNVEQLREARCDYALLYRREIFPFTVRQFLNPEPQHLILPNDPIHTPVTCYGYPGHQHVDIGRDRVTWNARCLVAMPLSIFANDDNDAILRRI